MPLYEHVVIARQDISGAQAEALMGEIGEMLKAGGGEVVGTEYWGLRSLAFKINKNRKGHYLYLRASAPAPAVHEMERRLRIHDDVMRYMTVSVDSHEEGQSAVLQNKNRGGDDRRGPGGPRGDRPDRGDRPRRRDDERGPRMDDGAPGFGEE